jgi:hypothetical protein
MKGVISLVCALAMLLGVVMFFSGSAVGLVVGMVGVIGLIVFYPRNHYYCLRCDQYLGKTPAFCSRCGSNRWYTQQES